MSGQRRLRPLLRRCALLGGGLLANQQSSSELSHAGARLFPLALHPQACNHPLLCYAKKNLTDLFQGGELAR